MEPPAVSDQALAEGMAGLPAVYRLCFRSSLIRGFPQEVDDSFTVNQTNEEQGSMHVRITQETGPQLVFRKQKLNLIAPEGLPKTFCLIPFETTSEMNTTIDSLRNQALGAIALVASFLDERVALEELFEDWMLLGENIGVIGDMSFRVRSYPHRVVTDVAREILERFPPNSSDSQAAARWYLKGAQLRPTIDVIFFWIAMEVLLQSAGEAVLGKLKAALKESSFEVDTLSVPLKKLYGIRGDLVHGKDVSDLLGPTFYDSEAILRHLLKISYGDGGGWPASVGRHEGDHRTKWAEPETRKI